MTGTADLAWGKVSPPTPPTARRERPTTSGDAADRHQQPTGRRTPNDFRGHGARCSDRLRGDPSRHRAPSTGAYRNEDAEGRADPGRAITMYRAAMALDDALGDREAEP